MEKVINSYPAEGFYRLAKDFLVTQSRFMSEDHLLVLKQDPHTIFSLYRMQMLHDKINLLSKLDRKLIAKRPGSKGTRII